MGTWWRIARRTAFALFALWLVLTATFLVMATTGDPNEALVRHAAALEAANDPTMDESDARAHVERAVAEYRAARGHDRPIHERYLDWLSGVLTFQWGMADSRPAPVTSLLSDRLAVTASYAVPGTALAVAGGVGLGTYAAFGRHAILRRGSVLATYTVYGVPNFWIAAVALAVVPIRFGIVLTGYDPEQSLYSSWNLQRIALPAVLLGTGLVGPLAQHVRAELVERKSRPWVRTARAGGLSRRRVSYYVVRAAALPLVSVTFSKLFGVLLVNVFVIEYVFGLPGFGSLTYDAILRRDLPLVTGATLVVAFVGVAGTYFQDLFATVLDPRVRLE